MNGLPEYKGFVCLISGFFQFFKTNKSPPNVLKLSLRTGVTKGKHRFKHTLKESTGVMKC